MIVGKPHIHRQIVDFDLLDAGSVVHHPNYLVICERARNAALDDAGYPPAELWADGYALALVSSTSRYLRGATLGQRLVVLTTVARQERTILAARQRILPAAAIAGEMLQGFVETIPEHSDKDLIYTVDLSLTCVKMNPLRATRFPQKLAEKLAIPAGPVTLEA